MKNLGIQVIKKLKFDKHVNYLCTYKNRTNFNGKHNTNYLQLFNCIKFGVCMKSIIPYVYFFFTEHRKYWIWVEFEYILGIRRLYSNTLKKLYHLF